MAFLSVLITEKCIGVVCEKFIIFPFGQYIDGNIVYRSFYEVVCCEIEVGICEKFAKVYSDSMKKSRICCKDYTLHIVAGCMV